MSGGCIPESGGGVPEGRISDGGIVPRVRIAGWKSFKSECRTISCVVKIDESGYLKEIRRSCRPDADSAVRLPEREKGICCIFDCEHAACAELVRDILGPHGQNEE